MKMKIMMKRIILSVMMLLAILVVAYIPKATAAATTDDTTTNNDIKETIQLNIWPHPQVIEMYKEFFVIDRNTFELIPSDGKAEQCELLRSAIDRYMEERFFLQDCSRVRLSPSSSSPLSSSSVGVTKHKTLSHQQQLQRTTRLRWKKKMLDNLEQFFHSRSVLSSRADSSSAGPSSSALNQIQTLHNVTVELRGPCETLPHLEMKESYDIVLQPGKTVIGSDTVWGLLRAFDTFAQLLQPIGRDHFSLPHGKVYDYPRFAHRGLLIDTARHYLPLHMIHATLDAMEMNKFNVLHWHVVDDQSFPFVSETFPELSNAGAYNNWTHTYTQAIVDDVIYYAAQRGIRVVVEFDTPGHTESWGKGRPELLTPCYNETSKSRNGLFGPLDPIQNSTYEFVEKFFAEIARRFPDQYLHLGGDEVSFECWRSNPSITQWMQRNKIAGNYEQLESFYIQKLLDIVGGLNKSYIVWQEVFDNKAKLLPNTVVQVWIANSGLYRLEMANVTKAGYRTLLSAPWYLDQISWTQDWIEYYQVEPLDFPGDAKQKALVFGGEACLWGEFVDGSNLLSKTWPRASAVAERLWSAATLNSAEKARDRFHAQHCRLLQHGFHPGPIDGPGYCPCDFALH